MTIGHLWLDDSQLQQIAGRNPSTQYGAALMQHWPKRYQGPLMTSASYRGGAAVLGNLLDRLNQGVAKTLREALDQVNHLLMLPATSALGEHFHGIAGVTLSNAWQTAFSQNLTPQEAMAAYESEMIYVARLFVEARGREARGEKLA